MIVNLDTKIAIDRPVAAQDGTYGSSLPTWEEYCAPWCEWRDELPSRSEALRNGLMQSSGRIRVRIRYRSDINSTMRVRRGLLKYQIVGEPAELGRREYLELALERFTTDGGAG